MGLVTMSDREVSRLDVLLDLGGGRITAQEAGRLTTCVPAGPAIDAAERVGWRSRVDP